jgi:hypothetical protein
VTQASKYLTIPEAVLRRDGPFEEFKQDAAMVSVELADGRQFHHLLVLYPNYIIAMKDHSVLPFDPADIVRAFQTERDRKIRSSSSWTFWPHPWSEPGA